jgi:surface antigen
MFHLVVMLFFIILFSACAERQDSDTVALNTSASRNNPSENKTIDTEMDGFDRSRLSRALEFNALGSAASWTNPITNTTFSVVPLEPFVNAENNCRRYELNIGKGASAEKRLLRACRSAIGSWLDQ